MFEHEINSGKKILIKIIREEIEKESPPSFSSAHIELSSFLDPIFFCFASTIDKREINLHQLVYGYIEQRFRPKKITVYSDQNGIVELTNIGYFKTAFPYTVFSFYIKNKKNILTRGNKKVRFRFIPKYLLKGTHIELRNQYHPYFSTFFKRISRPKKRDKKIVLLKNITKNRIIIEKALTKIKQTSAKQFLEIEKTTRMIVLLEGSKSEFAFTTLEMQGAIFIRPSVGSGVHFFIEHIIHESSHILMNFILIQIREYFRIHPFEERFSSPLKKKKRGIYHVIHANFVLAKIALFYSSMYAQKNYNKSDKYEVIGRLLLSFRRLEEGVSYIDDKKLFTKKGMTLIDYLIQTKITIQKKHDLLLKKYSVQKQKEEFDVNTFLRENKIVRHHTISSAQRGNI